MPFCYVPSFDDMNKAKGKQSRSVATTTTATTTTTSNGGNHDHIAVDSQIDFFVDSLKNDQEHSGSRSNSVNMLYLQIFCSCLRHNLFLCLNLFVLLVQLMNQLCWNGRNDLHRNVRIGINFIISQNIGLQIKNFLRNFPSGKLQKPDWRLFFAIRQTKTAALKLIDYVLYRRQQTKYPFYLKAMICLLIFIYFYQTICSPVKTVQGNCKKIWCQINMNNITRDHHYSNF